MRERGGMAKFGGLGFLSSGFVGVSKRNGEISACGRGTRACVRALPTKEQILKLLEDNEKEDEVEGVVPWEDSPDYQEFLRTNAERTLMKTEPVKCKDGMEFFRRREGSWKSWRISHHLAFRRDETGCSDVKTIFLESDDERIVALCKDHDIDPAKAQGGCYVTWLATMAWDQEGENHEGSTTFALVPDDDDVRKGKLLRDRGYAEIVPIIGTYYLDDEDALNLSTPYDGGEVSERFWFDGEDIVHRVSCVKRFGGFTNATFATERRTEIQTPVEKQTTTIPLTHGSPKEMEDNAPKAAPLRNAMYGSAARASYGRNNFGPPSARSAFGAPSTRSAFGPPSTRSAFSDDAAPDQDKTDEKPIST